jgi:ubiquinone/menaquinone biosynthesis C-methylase UbiE
MTKKKRLQLGCGKKPLTDYINHDLVNYEWVDVKHNLDIYPWPFEDNQFEEVYANSVIEHVEDLLACFGELHRILKPNGIFKGGVPWYNYGGAFGDPTHKQFFTKTTFDYLKSTSEYSYTETTGVWEINKLEFTPTKYGRIFPFKQKLLPKIGGVLGNIVHKINFELKVIK